MERIGEILRKTYSLQSTSRESTIGSSSTERGENGLPVCPVCEGSGYVRVEVPVGDPEFGKAHVCQCRLHEEAQERLERLQRLSNLGPLSRLTFDGFLPSGKAGPAAHPLPHHPAPYP